MGILVGDIVDDILAVANDPYLQRQHFVCPLDTTVYPIRYFGFMIDNTVESWKKWIATASSFYKVEEPELWRHVMRPSTVQVEIRRYAKWCYNTSLIFVPLENQVEYLGYLVWENKLKRV